MGAEQVRAVIITHVTRYPDIEIMDVYKLLHQSVFGPGHAIRNAKAAREWLERESDLLRPVETEPLVENIHPEGQIVRVHLRPYLALRGNLHKLLDAFVRSSTTVTGDPATLAAWWDIFEAMTAEGGHLAGRFDARQVRLIGRTQANEQWPASHHSPRFDRVYNPHYRVLTRDAALDLLRHEKMQAEIV